MATVKPFRAVRPQKQYADKVISLPYDVMNREEAAQMAEGNPYSFLHICRAEIDLPQADQHSQEVYEKARDNIADFRAKGIFTQEEAPALYVYREIMDGRVQTGIFGCVSVDEYKNNIIKKHELTRVEKEIDRINHFDVCNANTEPVFLTYRDDKRIRVIVEGWAEHHEPEYDITASDGIRHMLWPVTDENTIATLTGLFKEIPALYIADGHHRSASAFKVGMKRREEHIFDYNRVVKDLNGLDSESFLKKIEEAGFEVEEKGVEIYAPEAKHFFGMFIDGKWYRLKATDRIIPDHVIDSLDVAVLQNNLLGPVLGIDDPRTSDRIDFVGGIRGLAELERRVNSDMKVAFAVYPVSISDLLAVSDADMIMPPKSTWFEPKLGSGLLIHML